MTDKEIRLENIKKEIEKMNKKDFNVYFFVMDTKGNPSGSLTYIYQTAYELKEMGYNVTMIHQEKEFIGVEDWLGEKYASLPHKNIEQENVEITPADFLFVPEIYANVMSQTKNLPCKKVVIFQNQNYLTSTIPIGVTWMDMNIKDAVVNTKANENLVHKYFPGIKTWRVSPLISPCFRKSQEPQKLIVNVVSKNQTDIDKILKPFYWLYPIYKWVSFRDLRGLPQETLAEALNTGALTIWMDDETDFGYTLLEALRSGCVVMAKTPDNPTDWMVKDGKLIDGPIWFNNIHDTYDMIASIIRTWTLDEIPEEVYNACDKTADLYNKESHKQEITDAFINGIFESRKNELEATYNYFNIEK